MSEFGTHPLGTALREERLLRHRDLASISAETKIAPQILDAIERNLFECIPGGSYRHSFLRQYARALGLDGEEIVRSFKEQYEKPAEACPPPAPRLQPGLMRTRELLWALAGLSALTTLYYTIDTGRNRTDVEKSAVNPRRPVALPSAEAQSSTADKISSAISSGVHVEFAASEPVWILVKCDGALSFTGTLLGPQGRTFDAFQIVTVLIGNAGGLSVALNGRTIGTLGRRGEVQLFEFTPGGAHRRRRYPSQSSGGS